MVSSILGRKLQGRTLYLSYHVRGNDLYPSNDLWPCLFTHDSSLLLTELAALGRVPGLEHLFCEHYVESLAKQGRHDGGCCLLLGLNQIVPENTNTYITEEELLLLLPVAGESRPLMEGLSVARHIMDTLDLLDAWKGVALDQQPRPNPPVLTATNGKSLIKLERTLHSVIFAKTETAFIYLGGPPGTGKSLAVDWCVREARDRAFWKAYNMSTHHVVVTCDELTSIRTVYRAIETQMGCQDGKKALQEICSPSCKHYLFLVLEEATNLVDSGLDVYSQDRRAGEDMLAELTDLCITPCNFVVLATGNYLCGKYIDRMHSVAKKVRLNAIRPSVDFLLAQYPLPLSKPIHIHMAAYTATDLSDILQESRPVEVSRLDVSALELVAKKGAARGDAREALGLLNEVASSWSGPGRATAQYVHRVCSGSIVTTRSLVEGLPSTCKRFLAILLRLARSRECVRCCDLEDAWLQTIGDWDCEARDCVLNFLTTLKDTGVVDYEGDGCSGNPKPLDCITMSMDPGRLESYLDTTTVNWIGNMVISK